MMKFPVVPNLLILGFLIDCISCQDQSSDGSIGVVPLDLFTISRAHQSTPPNHRMNPDEVPSLKVALNRSVSQVNDELPFNVDFVEQPDLFKVGQSFFMPTMRVPAILYEPRTSSSSQDLHIEGSHDTNQRRWSVAYDETNESKMMNQLPTGLSLSTNRTQSPSAPASSAVKFDDDEYSENRYQITTVTPGDKFSGISDEGHLANRSMQGLESVSLDAMARTRKQMEIDLKRSLAEQKKLIKLLTQRINGPPMRLVERKVSLDGHRNSFVPFQRTNHMQLPRVPTNHVVEHPKMRKKSIGHSSRHPAFSTSQYIGSFSSHEPSASSGLSSVGLGSIHGVQKFSDDDTGQRQKFVDTREGLRQKFHENTQQLTQQPNLQHFSPLTYTTMPMADHSPSQSRMATHSKPLGGVRRPVDVEEDEKNDKSDHFESQAINWLEEQGDDEDLAARLRSFGLDTFSSSPSPRSVYELYHQPIFTSSVMENYDRNPAAPRPRRVRTKSMNDYIEPFNQASYQASSETASNSLAGRYGDHSDHHQRAPSERQFYEISAGLTPSNSHKVIHIHTKEKKGHGKYLWPILGSGLVMLMGFLIISNMLLSIPLLAMGASSLFGQVGNPVQQLVPIYNLSQLARPVGRRRKRRWISPQMRLANEREDFNFDTMLRRVMAKFAMSNKCKATNSI